MMRALLLLSLVGAAIYGFLVITGDALSGGNSKDGVASRTQPQPNHSADERLSSWGSYLPSRSPSQDPQLATSQEPAALPSRESNEPSQNSGRYQIAVSRMEQHRLKATPRNQGRRSTVKPPLQFQQIRPLRLPNPLYENQAPAADPPNTALWSPTRIRGMAHGLDTSSDGVGLGCSCSAHFQDLRRKVDEVAPPVKSDSAKSEFRCRWCCLNGLTLCSRSSASSRTSRCSTAPRITGAAVGSLRFALNVNAAKQIAAAPPPSQRISST